MPAVRISRQFGLRSIAGTTKSVALLGKATADIKRQYANASIVTNERVVFNIKGNDYRMVVAIDFGKAIVWIKWIGSHEAYDKIDVRNVRYDK